MQGEARIQDYDSRWPAIYAAQAAALSRALEGRALRIEHIGSTAVPGLAAVPVVDLLLVVEDPEHEAAYLPQLAAAGMVWRPVKSDRHEHRVFENPRRDLRLHVFFPGSPEIDGYLRLRDRLRNNPAERRRYEEIKRKLAAELADAPPRRRAGPVGPTAAWAPCPAPLGPRFLGGQPSHG